MIKNLLKKIENYNNMFFNSILINVIFSLFLIILILLFYNDNLNKINKKNFEFIAENTVSHLYTKMQHNINKEKINNFIYKELPEIDGIKQLIYRKKKVKELFGPRDNKIDDKYIEKINSYPVYISGLEKNIYYYPIKAKNKCLQCHTNAKVNDTLGVLKIIQEKEPITDIEIIKMFFKYFLMLILFVIILFYYYKKIYISENNKILSNFFSFLNNEIKKIKNYYQLEKFKVNKKISNIPEINEFINNYQAKIKELTYDKTLMNFQLDLLETFIITTEVIDNWVEYLKKIFVKLNKLLTINLLYAVTKIEKNKYEVLILWKYNPSQKLKTLIEEDILLKFNNKKLILLFKHEIIYKKINYNDENNIFIKDKELEKCNTKSLIMPKPCIGGIIGVGFDNNDNLLKDNEKIKHAMFENVLTVLINLIGSIKTINTYINNINNLATRDTLTNLLNRRVFYELANIKLEKAIRHKKKFYLLFIDVDNFKIINDNYGHNSGDMFLRKLSEILKDNIRSEDILARYGGDEFIIILDEHDLEQTKSIVKRIQDGLEKYKNDKKNNIPKEVTLSIGIVEYPDHGDTIEELLIVADEMMYKSKNDGKNQIITCDTNLLYKLIEKNKLKKKLVFDAVKNFSLIPYFQKIESINDDNEEIYELLMRIKLGNEILEANEFIEIAESTGLINELDLQLFEKALIYLNDKKYTGKLFVNISPKSLMAYNYIEKLLDIINKYPNIKNENIIFEITERDTVKNIVSLERLIKELNNKKFKFAIDDFGSGFSSFLYIQKFEVSYLKIDGSFINNILNNKKDLIFVKSIIYMAKELNIKVIAEFVENKETLERLKELKVDYVQGYYINKPKDKID